MEEDEDDDDDDDCSKAQPKFFFRVGANPEAVYNMCLILKTILQK